MGEPVLLYKRAGTVIKVLAWVTVVAWAGIFLAILIPTLAGKTPQIKSMWPSLFLSVIPALLIWFQFSVAIAIQAHKDWGRIVGIIYGALNLLGFPIGTIIGGYILWCLIKGWDEVAAPAPETAGQGY
jgi:hypothetical protein